MPDRRRKSDQFMLFAGIEGDAFATELAAHLRMSLSPVKYTRFLGAVPGGGETKPEILCSVEERRTVVIWSPGNTNDELVQVCQLIRTLKMSGGAESVALVVPCYPYARQDKSHGRREAVLSRWTADVLEASGMDRIFFLDVHSDQTEGFFTHARVHSLWMDDIWIHYLSSRLPGLMRSTQLGRDNVRLMPPDEGAVGPNYRVAKRLQAGMVVHLKHRDWEKKHAVLSLGIAGKVKACILLCRDDILASGDTLITAARKAKAGGARYVLAVACHPLAFDKPSTFENPEPTFIERMMDPALDELAVTNSVSHFLPLVLASSVLREKVSVLDVAPFFGIVLGRLGRLTIREMMKDVDPQKLYRVLHCSDRARALG